MRKANVYFDRKLCGILEETDTGYRFRYTSAWYSDPSLPPVSLTMPKDKQVYDSPIFFPFFDGLIPEGYLLEKVVDKWSIPYKDRFGLLLKSGMDTIGAVSVEEAEEHE